MTAKIYEYNTLVKGYYHYTSPLVNAIKSGHYNIEIIKVLLEHGAQVFFQQNNNNNIVIDFIIIN